MESGGKDNSFVAKGSREMKWKLKSKARSRDIFFKIEETTTGLFVNGLIQRKGRASNEAGRKGENCWSNVPEQESWGWNAQAQSRERMMAKHLLPWFSKRGPRPMASASLGSY